jgi:DNA repair exonuclease SbcCD ATPase subunit
MPDTDEYLKQLKTRIDELKADLERATANVKTAAAGARADYEKSVRILKERKDELERAAQALKTGSGKAWEELKEGTESAWKSLAEAWQKAKADWDRT